ISLWSLTKKKPVCIVSLAHGLDPPLQPAEFSAEHEPNPKATPVPTPRYITALKTIPYSDVILSGSWDGYVRVWRLIEDKKRIEPVGVLGGGQAGEADGGDNEGDDSWAIRGVINDIAVFERGERGADGLCVVAAVGKEHRLGRWKVARGGRNGGV